MNREENGELSGKVVTSSTTLVSARAVKRAQQAMRCLPFRRAFYNELEHEALSSTQLSSRKSWMTISRWQRMRGRWAELHTGHCLLLKHPTPETTSRYLTCVTTRVQFSSICDKEIESYVASGEPLRCAGGFALEGTGGLYVERLDGCFSNVIGLSLPLIREWLSSIPK